MKTSVSAAFLVSRLLFPDVGRDPKIESDPNLVLANLRARSTCLRTNGSSHF